MSRPLRDDAVYRTRQAWLRTGLGATAVAALAVRAAVLGGVNAPALIVALAAVALVVGVGLQRGRPARGTAEVSRGEAILVAVAICLLGVSGALLAVASR